MEAVKSIKLACAPIAWTNDDMPELGRENTFEQCISEMALAGYEGTEIGNKYPNKPDVLKDYLDIRGLNVASAWFSSFLTSEPYEYTEKLFIEHRDFLDALGAKVIVVSEQGNSIQGKNIPLFKNKPVFSDEDWERVTTGLEKLGELANEKNMSIVYHHHMGTGVQTTEEIDKLMQETDPNLVSLLYDTGHLVFSGEDPIKVFDKHVNRIKHIHFKDIRKNIAEEVVNKKYSFLEGIRKGVFTVPGDGSIDFEPIVNRIKESGYEGWIVVEAEQDPAIANPYQYALLAKKNIDSLLQTSERSI
ncbi:MAG: myo-inosose-2 dehydratase [Staphylococcus equorum]|nr:myo-inosose-2 dehydratase [Staphylococcus equorum]MDN6721366.1 myo-inosose-2 dehydratase [Staphylococcus equorum]MDN6730739.1 myo-inosose-2 dehydratase [Atopostipes suicloacalis]